MRGSEVGVELNRPLVFLDRSVGPPHHQSGIAEREMRPRVAVVEFGRPAANGSASLQVGRTKGPAEEPRNNIAKASKLCAGA